MDVFGIQRIGHVALGIVSSFQQKSLAQPQGAISVTSTIDVPGMLLFALTMGAFIIQIACIVSQVA